ncbi:hypothetical protein SAMN05216303_1011286 [Rhodoferax sp. OV413]|uniref:hypothetical protein n=1 Tax=Rhodoferax sp. OV413 TaxID=1855285 RepID=UPI00088A365F|nr:hypothetical protein [Rhodoferax sp. OV413]SDO38571.1 hypothetical protein SAMN05216303_1011286 [Rhodoferax sp. OV413]
MLDPEANLGTPLLLICFLRAKRSGCLGRTVIWLGAEHRLAQATTRVEEASALLDAIAEQYTPSADIAVRLLAPCSPFSMVARLTTPVMAAKLVGCTTTISPNVS